MYTANRIDDEDITGELDATFLCHICLRKRQGIYHTWHHREIKIHAEIDLFPNCLCFPEGPEKYSSRFMQRTPSWAGIRLNPQTPSLPTFYTSHRHCFEYKRSISGIHPANPGTQNGIEALGVGIAPRDERDGAGHRSSESLHTWEVLRSVKGRCRGAPFQSPLYLCAIKNLAW